MSTTRLLLLGAVRVFPPVHGYLLRRELLSWQVEDWAHVEPGRRWRRWAGGSACGGSGGSPAE